jgi:hypothetical protein
MIAFLAILMLISMLGVVITIGSFVYYDINKQKIEAEMNMSKKIRSEDELMQIVFSILERKWAYRVQFHFKIKEITIPKFEFEWNYLLEETMNAVSPDVMEELRYYYKDDETTIKAVSEMIQIYLYSYMESKMLKR